MSWFKRKDTRLDESILNLPMIHVNAPMPPVKPPKKEPEPTKN